MLPQGCSSYGREVVCPRAPDDALTCSCGSINSGQRVVLQKMQPFSTEKASAGNPLLFHIAISTSETISAMGFGVVDIGILRDSQTKAT